MLAKVKTVNGTKKLIPLTGTAGGIPLGTWASFEGGVAPNEDWLEAGTTFDPAKYPFLFNMLGTNVVPERFDHTKELSPYEIIPTGSVPSIATSNVYAFPYDGVLTISGARGSTLYAYIVPAGNIANRQSFNCYNNTTANTSDQVTLPFHKGDGIQKNGSNDTFKVRYYKQHLFIKATPIAYESDGDVIKDYVQTANSYSTEEKLTGGTWINGKPIYRRTMSGSWHIENSWTAIDSTTPFDELLNADIVGYHKANGAIHSYLHPTRTMNAYVQLDASKKLMAYTGSNDWITAVTLEYTKSTDQATS